MLIFHIGYIDITAHVHGSRDCNPTFYLVIVPHQEPCWQFKALNN